jgi:hypothetical protein
MAFYVADTFRGSGSVHNSTPEAKHASVGNWTIYSGVNPGPPNEDSYQVLRRGPNGLYAFWNGTDEDTVFPFIKAAGTVTLGAGVLVVEAKFRGTLPYLTVRYGTGEGISRIGVDSGQVYLQLEASLGGYYVFDTPSVSRATTSVVRIEVDLSTGQRRGYLNNALLGSATYALPTAVSSVEVHWNYWDEIGDPYNTTTNIAVEYINAQIDTVSGPLGVPVNSSGGAIILKKLAVSAGQFRVGRATISVPKLSAAGGNEPTTTVIWDNLVRCREAR